MTSSSEAAAKPLSGSLTSLPVPLDRDVFLRSLVRELAGALEDVVGLEEAAGFISIVGQRMGDQVNEAYRQALGVNELDPAQVTAVLVDMKRRIQGDFEVLAQDTHHIVLGNRRCPFGDKVLGRPSMCMMTSNVFGVIAAENLGQARVVLEKTIAQGDGHCRVVVHLNDAETTGPEAPGRRYFKA